MKGDQIMNQDLNESSFNDTRENAKYKEAILKNVEIMKQAFRRIDLNKDNYISYVELSDFLDGKLKVK